MARAGIPDCDINVSSKADNLLYRFIILNQSVLSEGFSIQELKNVYSVKSRLKNGTFLNLPYSLAYLLLGICFLTLIVSVVLRSPYFDGMVKSALGIKCVVPNNYLVWEATRPIADCSICKEVNGVLILPNVTREEFEPYAYSYRPILVRGAALHWPAAHKFNYNYFKELFEKTPGSYESVEDECQFLSFKTELTSLQEVFSMPVRRVEFQPGEKPWYIGWSNCHPDILTEMRKHYSKPHFLPSDAEHSHIDYIFMGYQQGAFMHLDYISRLMWQAQLIGSKLWRLAPPPECEVVCQPFSFSVQPGDILLLDTRQWYHDTQVLDESFSLTVSSEYG